MRTAKAAGAKKANEPAVRLRCLGGSPAPDGLLDEAHRINKLPQGAVANLWDVLEPCLADAVSQEIDQQLGAFCRRHEVAEADLGHVLRIARFLLRSAASINLDNERFGEDLETTWPSASSLHEVLLNRFEATKAALRGRLLADALMKHGHVLQNIEWRVDSVVADTSAPRLQMPVGIVTLTHRYRDRSESLTLQMTPDQLMRAAQVFGSLAQQTQQLLPTPPATAASQEEPASETKD